MTIIYDSKLLLYIIIYCRSQRGRHIRLVNGTVEKEGRLEICIDGISSVQVACNLSARLFSLEKAPPPFCMFH